MNTFLKRVAHYPVKGDSTEHLSLREIFDWGGPQIEKRLNRITRKSSPGQNLRALLTPKLSFCKACDQMRNFWSEEKSLSGYEAISAETVQALRHVLSCLIMIIVNASHVLIKNNSNLFPHPLSPLLASCPGW